jgi:hypothetical protein
MQMALLKFKPHATVRGVFITRRSEEIARMSYVFRYPLWQNQIASLCWENDPFVIKDSLSLSFTHKCPLAQQILIRDLFELNSGSDSIKTPNRIVQDFVRITLKRNSKDGDSEARFPFKIYVDL